MEEEERCFCTPKGAPTRAKTKLAIGSEKRR